MPLSHPFVERLIGTTRREFLDHVLFWNGHDLERKLAEFQRYYNAARCHASLDGRTPLTFAGGHAVASADLSRVRWVSHCHDLGLLHPAPAVAFDHRTFGNVHFIRLAEWPVKGQLKLQWVGFTPRPTSFELFPTTLTDAELKSRN